MAENSVAVHGIEGVGEVNFEKGFLAALLVQFGPLPARVNGGIYSKLASHSNLERFKESLGVCLDCVAQTLADDPPQDLSNCNWSDPTLGLF